MRLSERDGKAFSLPIHKIDDIPNEDARVYDYIEKQYILLPEREDSSRR